MAIQYTASIGSVSTLDESGNNNVVKAAVYELTATEGDESYHSMRSVDLGDADDSFTAYESLTENTVIGWCEAVLGSSEVAAMKVGLASQFTTPIASAEPQNKQLPW